MISDVTDEANAIVRLSGNDRTIFKVQKGVLGVEKVVISGLMTAEDLLKVDAAASRKAQDTRLCGSCRLSELGIFLLQPFSRK